MTSKAKYLQYKQNKGLCLRRQQANRTANKKNQYKQCQCKKAKKLGKHYSADDGELDAGISDDDDDDNDGNNGNI